MRTQLLCALALLLATGTAEAKTFYGIASWYGPGFEGRRMANGKVFRTLRESAAMRVVPLGSLVRVTNLDNGRWMLVMVTDRGPYVRHRIIDLSLGAAFRLGVVSHGIARVRVETVYSPLAANLMGRVKVQNLKQTGVSTKVKAHARRTPRTRSRVK